MNTVRPHILFIRLSAMGDVAMTAPVVKAFRTANPDVDITILTRPFFQPFFRDIEGVEFITPDFNGRHKGFGGLVRLSHDISSCGITHIADLHDVLRTKILRRLLHRKRHVAVIDKGRDKKRALTRKNNKLKVQLEPMVDRYRDTVMRLGFPVGALLPVTQAPLPVPEAIGRVVKKKTGKWIGFAPFAKHRGKIYPAEHTDRLIGILTERYKHVFLFGGGPYERDFAEAMEKRHPGAVSVIGKVDLNGELDLISNLDVMISMDSSAMHMASLVGTPVVSIWGATHPYAGFYGFGQDPANAVQLDLSCRPCSVYGNKSCMYGDYRCLERISPETVAEAVGRTVKKRRRKDEEATSQNPEKPKRTVKKPVESPM